jgi:20S proteasome alpha/beta subunit
MIRPPILIPNRLPYKPTKPYIRSTMTIAAGFTCEKGIVLCADRLISQHRNLRRSAFK